MPISDKLSEKAFSVAFSLVSAGLIKHRLNITAGLFTNVIGIFRQPFVSGFFTGIPQTLQKIFAVVVLSGAIQG